MKEINVTGQKRSDLGKKATKLLRKEGLVPCNLYGEAKDENGKPKALAFAVPMADLRKLVYTPHIYVVNLIIDGESHPAIMKELQFHPVTDSRGQANHHWHPCKTERSCSGCTRRWPSEPYCSQGERYR